MPLGVGDEFVRREQTYGMASVRCGDQVLGEDHPLHPAVVDRQAGEMDGSNHRSQPVTNPAFQPVTGMMIPLKLMIAKPITRKAWASEVGA